MTAATATTVATTTTTTTQKSGKVEAREAVLYVLSKDMSGPYAGVPSRTGKVPINLVILVSQRRIGSA